MCSSSSSSVFFFWSQSGQKKLGPLTQTSLKVDRSFFPILHVSFCLFLRTGTFQHSVIFRHFFGPHNKNKGECRSKHNHQEQRSFTCSFSFSNPLSALCQTMLLCCFFFAYQNFPTFFLCYFKTLLWSSQQQQQGRMQIAEPKIIVKQNSKPRL